MVPIPSRVSRARPGNAESVPEPALDGPASRRARRPGPRVVVLLAWLTLLPLVGSAWFAAGELRTRGRRSRARPPRSSRSRPSWSCSPISVPP